MTDTIGNNVSKLAAFDRTPRLAELKVSYRRSRNRRVKKERNEQTLYGIRDSKSCEKYLREIWNQDTIELREEFIVLCLNNAHEVLGWINVSSGGLSATVVDPRIIFGVALQTVSASIIVAHNHPSGSVIPSPHDKAITQQLRAAGKVLGITLLDHLIVSRDSYYSFADSGWTE